jgi:glycosyltransferase involved in cell wall biosynthesis
MAQTVRSRWKVLWITERFPPERGGAAVSAGRQVEALAGHLERLDVVRLCRKRASGQVELEERADYGVYHVGAAAAHEESLQIVAQTATNLLGAHRHDLVHGFYAVHAGYVAVAVARAAGLRSVVSLRGNDLDRAMFHGPRLPFLLYTLEHADALLVVSPDMSAKVRALCGRTDGIHHVQNGVDAELFTPRAGTEPEPAEVADAPRPRIGFVGELRLKKGLPVLLDLAARMAERDLGTLLLVGGVRSDERDAVERWRRRSAAAAARVREFAYRNEPAALAALYRSMDLVVFPSLWDGLPNALLEAMACARPVLASAVGGLAAVVRDGETGFLVPPGDLDRFAMRALELATGDLARLERVGAAARAQVLRDYSPAAERDAILAVHRQLVS